MLALFMLFERITCCFFPLLNFDSCEVGTENWVQCNDSPIKVCKYPVSGLFEGHSYYFRVRAVNSHGISRPSRMSEPIAALDPTEFERLHGKHQPNAYRAGVTNMMPCCKNSTTHQ